MAANTSGSTGVPSISAKPCREKNCFSKVSTNSRRSPSSRAPVDERARRCACPTPRPTTRGCTATVRISPRSSHSTCSAPQPTTWPSSSATRNSGTASYSVTISLASSTRPAYPSTSCLIVVTSAVRARRTVTVATAGVDHGSGRYPDARAHRRNARAAPRRAALVTLGCARNEVDSEELAGRLVGSGWELVDADGAGRTPRT